MERTADKPWLVRELAARDPEACPPRQSSFGKQLARGCWPMALRGIPKHPFSPFSPLAAREQPPTLAPPVSPRAPPPPPMNLLRFAAIATVFAAASRSPGAQPS